MWLLSQAIKAEWQDNSLAVWLLPETINNAPTTLQQRQSCLCLRFFNDHTFNDKFLIQEVSKHMFIIYVRDSLTKNKSVKMRIHIFTKIINIRGSKQKKKTFSSYFISQIPNFSYMHFSENAQCFAGAFL